MGLKCSPDYAQEVMENILRVIPESEVYIDDIDVFTNTLKEHLRALQFAETLGDPYKGRIPLPSIPYYRA